MELSEASRLISNFRGQSLKQRLAECERELRGSSIGDAEALRRAFEVDADLLSATLTIKNHSQQIDEVLHAVGMLTVIPMLLETDEQIEYLSLGAGNTGKEFDLSTTLRIAEFKFIRWRGNDAVRQDSLFKDYVGLGEATTTKRRELYVVDLTLPLKFLCGGRAIKSVLGKHPATLERLLKRHGERFQVVRDYYECRRTVVALRDLKELLPVPLD